MLVDLGNEPKNKHGVFEVIANIYSEKENEYVKHWFGGRFDNYDDAYEFWDSWEPSENEIYSIMRSRREQGDLSHHELEVGVFCEGEEDLAFMNRGLDVENERPI